MKIKIGDTVYDSSKEPILLILTPMERLDIIAMPPGVDKYVSSPEGSDMRLIQQWILGYRHLPLTDRPEGRVNDPRKD